MRFIFSFLFLFVALQSVSQNRDSLMNEWLDKDNSDTTRLSTLHVLVWKHYLFFDPDSAIYYGQQGLDLARESRQQYWEAKALNTLGLAYGYIGNQEEQLAHYQQSLEISRSMDDQESMAKVFNNLASVHTSNGDFAKATRMHLKSLDIKRQTNDRKGEANSLYNLGVLNKKKGDYMAAIAYLDSCLKIETELGDKKSSASTISAIGNILRRQGNYSGAIQKLLQSLSLYESLENLKGISDLYANIGIIYEEQGNHDRALEYYRYSLKSKQELNDELGIASITYNMGIVNRKVGDLHSALINFQKSERIWLQYDQKREYATAVSGIGDVLHLLSLEHFENNDKTEYQRLRSEAILHFKKALELRKEINDGPGTAESLNGLAMVYSKTKEYEKAIALHEEALALAEEAGAALTIQASAEALYKIYKGVGKASKALEMQDLYYKMRDSTLSLSNAKEILRQEFKHSYERQTLSDSLEFAKRDAIRDLEIKNKETNLSRQRIMLISISAFLIVSILLAIFIHRSKKKTDELLARSDELLLNILPHQVAEELKQTGSAVARKYDSVTVLFTDFKDFTTIASTMDAEMLVEVIDEIFKAFDSIIGTYGLEKIKTIGDAYLAAGGLPTVTNDHALKMVQAAIEMQTHMMLIKKRRLANGQPYFETRIGIHTGPVVAGVVGTKKFAYDIWGDTVNTAARLESGGEVGRVNISETTFELVQEHFECEFRGEIEAKGKGMIKMYFVKQTA